jgi:hypothetical protein
MAKTGDHVRLVNVLKHPNYPVGIVERTDGLYIYVHTPVADETPKDRCVFEVYDTEIVYITEQEYFASLLKGDNIRA